MIISKKSHPNLSDYIQLLIKKIEFNKKKIISSENLRNSGNYNYDYVHPFFENEF